MVMISDSLASYHGMQSMYFKSFQNSTIKQVRGIQKTILELGEVGIATADQINSNLKTDQKVELV